MKVESQDWAALFNVDTYLVVYKKLVEPRASYHILYEIPYGIIPILVFTWFPYAVYNAVTNVVMELFVSFQVSVPLCCRKQEDFSVVHSPTFIIYSTVSHLIHSLCIITLFCFKFCPLIFFSRLLIVYWKVVYLII